MIVVNLIPFPLTDWVRRWLGEFIVEQLQRSPCVVLTSKQSSLTPELLNDENHVLSARVAHLLWGIAAVAGVPMFNLARLFSGSNAATGISIRHTATFENFWRSASPSPIVGLDEFGRAVKFAEQLDEVMHRKAVTPQAFWRFISGTNAFVNALKSQDDEESAIHQRFVRAIESSRRRRPPAHGTSFGRRAISCGRSVSELPGMIEPEALGKIRKTSRSVAANHRFWGDVLFLTLTRRSPCSSALRQAKRRLSEMSPLCSRRGRKVAIRFTSTNRYHWNQTAQSRENVGAIWGPPMDVDGTVVIHEVLQVQIKRIDGTP